MAQRLFQWRGQYTVPDYSIIFAFKSPQKNSVFSWVDRGRMPADM